MMNERNKKQNLSVLLFAIFCIESETQEKGKIYIAKRKNHM